MHRRPSLPQAAYHPVIGVGANNGQIHFPGSSLPNIYPVQDLNVTYQRPHNDFLWILSEYGIVGFNLYLLFIVSLLFFLLFMLLNNFQTRYLILLSGIIGFLCISFFDFPKERIEHNVLIGILLALSLNLIRKKSPEVITKLFYFPKYALRILIPCFIVLFCFSLLNYKGEYFTKKMYIERFKKNNVEVIKLCNKAQTFCYTIDPTSVPLSWYKGNANANLVNYDAAREDFKYGYHVHPYNPQLLNDLGSSYAMNDKIDSAKIFYLESARINPRFDDPKLNLTAIFINEGNFKEAKRWNESIFHDSERRSYYRNIINKLN